MLVLKSDDRRLNCPFVWTKCDIAVNANVARTVLNSLLKNMSVKLNNTTHCFTRLSACSHTKDEDAIVNC